MTCQWQCSVVRTWEWRESEKVAGSDCVSVSSQCVLIWAGVGLGQVMELGERLWCCHCSHLKLVSGDWRGWTLPTRQRRAPLPTQASLPATLPYQDSEWGDICGQYALHCCCCFCWWMMLMPMIIMRTSRARKSLLRYFSQILFFASQAARMNRYLFVQAATKRRDGNYLHILMQLLAIILIWNEE